MNPFRQLANWIRRIQTEEPQLAKFITIYSFVLLLVLLAKAAMVNELPIMMLAASVGVLLGYYAFTSL